MREIVVLSGKGGTGKTSLTAAFAGLADAQVICDLDVDAPDLHLLLKPEHRHASDFYSGAEAVVSADRCTGCGLCVTMCRFDAVRLNGDAAAVSPLKCEGCKLCVQMCPEGAIDFPQRHCGRWYISDTRFGTLVHAQLFPGQENSGRLVALLRQQARELARQDGSGWILSDGPPGIGCPVISSLSGADLAVIVTEPTPSGVHDLQRILDLCDHFRVPAAVIVNKFDLNAALAERIADTVAGQKRRLIACLPHDPAFVEAMVREQTILEYSHGETADRLRSAWRALMQLCQETTADSAE
jgi:MinD superfamily P-loop ATPase